jgi:hypothetical protein
MKTHKNKNGIEYYSTTDENGETIFSFSPSFNDIWSQEDQDAEDRRGHNRRKGSNPKGKGGRMTTQKQIRAAFWQAHPTHEAYARKWEIKTAPHNRHNAETRTAFSQFVDTLAKAGEISETLASRATL